MAHEAPSDSLNVRRRVYAPVLLCVTGMLAAAVFMNPSSGPSPFVSQAGAQQATRNASSGGSDGDDPSGRVSAAEQRKEMIALLKGLSTRLDHLESTMTHGISVKVTDMPALKLPSDSESKPAAAAPAKPASITPSRPVVRP